MEEVQAAAEDRVKADGAKAVWAVPAQEARAELACVRNADIESRTNAAYPASRSNARSAGPLWFGDEEKILQEGG